MAERLSQTLPEQEQPVIFESSNSITGTKEYDRIKSILNPDNLLKPLERIPTPIDNRGIVDLSLLLQDVNTFVREDYEWQGKEDSHHSYWFKKLYNEPSLPNRDVELSRRFRSMPLHIVELPRELHDFIHAVTLPVVPPTEEVMIYRLQSWDIAVSLFNSAKVIKDNVFIDEDEIARIINRKTVDKKMKILESQVREVGKLPNDFRFFDIRPFRSVLGAGSIERIEPWKINKAVKSLRNVGAVARRGGLKKHDKKLLAA